MVYSTNAEIPGHLLIINNKTFKNAQGDVVDIRKGTDEDAERLKKVFIQGFGFKLTERPDLTANVCINNIRMQVHFNLPPSVSGKIIFLYCIKLIQLLS